MKRFLIIFLFLIFCSEFSYALQSVDQQGSYNINSGSQIGNTYYSWNNSTQSYTGYTQQNNQIYGSNGSSYTRFGNTIQDNSTGRTYQINNNLVDPLQ